MAAEQLAQASARSRSRRPSLPRLAAIWPPLALAAFFLIAWDRAVVTFGIKEAVLPGPAAVLHALQDGFEYGYLTENAWYTFIETVGGFVIGACIGLVLAVLISEFEIARRLLYPYVIALQTVPKIAVAPLFVVWIGFGIESKIAIAATIVFFPVLVNTMAGLRSLDREAIEMMTAFGADRMQLFLRGRVYASLPFMFAGLDVAVVFSVMAAIVAEFVGANRGLGFLILQAQFKLDIARVFAVLIVLSIMAFALHLAIASVQRRVVFWHQGEQAVARGGAKP